MKKFTFVFITVLAALLFSGCSEAGQDPVTYAIGDIGPSGAGIVFYVTTDGLHGLEAAPEDQNGGAAVSWSSITDAFADGSSALPTDLGTGSANTDAIIDQNGGAASAAQICRDYTGGGLTDWFLPSKDELNLLYGQKATVGNFITDDSYAYWTSSEGIATSAYYQWFSNGSSGTTGKTMSHLVRAIRAF